LITTLIFRQSSGKTTGSITQKSPAVSRVLRNHLGSTSSNALVTSLTSIDGVTCTLLSFQNDHISSNKAQSATQGSQFKDLKNDFKQLSSLVEYLKAENSSALRVEIDLLKEKVRLFLCCCDIYCCSSFTRDL